MGFIRAMDDCTIVHQADTIIEPRIDREANAIYQDQFFGATYAEDVALGFWMKLERKHPWLARVPMLRPGVAPRKYKPGIKGFN